MFGEFAGRSLERPVLSILAEQTVLSLAVDWEVFLSDYFVACINRDSRTFKAWLRTVMRKQIRMEFGEKASRYTQIALPKHPTLDDIAKLADPSERNIPLKSARDIVKKAKEWLPPLYADKFRGLATPDRDFIDALICIRNYLAHQSVSSGREMNRALERLATSAPLADVGRGKKRVWDVGAFLESWSLITGLPRIITYCDMAASIASKL